MEGRVNGAAPRPDRKPRERPGITHKVEITDGNMVTHEGYIVAQTGDDGSLAGIFLHGFGKAGSTMEGWFQLFATLFNYALQEGKAFDALIRKIAHMRFEPYGYTNNPEIPECVSVPDYVARWLARRFGTEELVQALADVEHVEWPRSGSGR